MSNVIACINKRFVVKNSGISSGLFDPDIQLGNWSTPRISRASEAQQRVLDFSLSLSELSELRLALICLSQASHL